MYRNRLLRYYCWPYAPAEEEVGGGGRRWRTGLLHTMKKILCTFRLVLLWWFTKLNKFCASHSSSTVCDFSVYIRWHILIHKHEYIETEEDFDIQTDIYNLGHDAEASTNSSRRDWLSCMKIKNSSLLNWYRENFHRAFQKRFFTVSAASWYPSRTCVTCAAGLQL